MPKRPDDHSSGRFFVSRCKKSPEASQQFTEDHKGIAGMTGIKKPATGEVTGG